MRDYHCICVCLKLCCADQHNATLRTLTLTGCKNILPESVDAVQLACRTNTVAFHRVTKRVHDLVELKTIPHDIPPPRPGTVKAFQFASPTQTLKDRYGLVRAQTAPVSSPTSRLRSSDAGFAQAPLDVLVHVVDVTITMCACFSHPNVLEISKLCVYLVFCLFDCSRPTENTCVFIRLCSS